MSVPATTVEHDWRAFSQIPELRDHWDRQGWWPGRSGYYWYVTFQGCADLKDLVARCQEPFRGDPAYDLMPVDAIHMTLARIGFAEEVTESELDEVEQHTENVAKAHSALSIAVGPLAGSAGALNFSVTPFRPIDRLRVDLSAAAGAVVDTVCSEGEFRPHVSIAYRNSPGIAGPIIDKVARLRSLPPVDVRVHQVSLVRLTRGERSYHWSPRRTFTLGAA